MIIYGLLQHTHYDEILFWLSEYIHSGYTDHIWCLIDKIFFDFYILDNPDFYKYIVKKRNMYYKKQNIKYILDIFKNLYYLKHSYYLFEFRLSFQHEGFTKKTIRGRRPGWITHFKEENREMLLNISKLRSDNVVVLYNNYNNYKSLYHDLCIYIKEHSKHIPTKDTTFVEHMITIFSKYKREALYKQLCMVIIYKLSIIPPTINKTDKKHLFIKSSKKELTLFHAYHKEQIKNKYNWMFIRTACIHGVTPLVHVFNHSRKGKEYWKQIWYSWEYYAYSSPLWKKRIDENGGKLNHTKNCVVFKDDDLQENFYETYGLEPDEQDKVTQDKFICEYEAIPITTLFTKIWKHTSHVLDDSYMYNY